MQPWFYPVVKYCFNAICFTRFIFVNSVIVSSIISCNDLYQDFIIINVWYFVSRNSISVLGAIWPSLSPCTVINPILLTYLLTLYVDDFVIMYKSSTIDAIQRKLQHTINRLEKWTLENGFTISKNETVAMHFCPDKKCMDPVFKLDNDHIQFVKEAKFLGLIWDTKLTFEPHIKYLKAWCQKSLNILKVLSRTEWGADRTTLLELYRSLVRSKLDYGCIVYGSASKTTLAKLDPVHNQGLRLSLGAFRSSPVESLYVEAHEPPLEIRREKLALQYTIKLKANPGNPAYDVVFNPKYQDLYRNKESATDSFGIHCKKLLKEAKIDVGEIAINSIPDVPIWDSEPVTIDFTLSEFDKSSTSSTVFKSRFNEVKQKYLDFCHIYTDGSKVETKIASA